MRTSLLIREFVRLSGKAISVRIGDVLSWSELEPLRDRKELLDRLYRGVFALAPIVARRGFRSAGDGPRWRPEDLRAAAVAIPEYHCLDRKAAPAFGLQISDAKSLWPQNSNAAKGIIGAQAGVGYP